MDVPLPRSALSLKTTELEEKKEAESAKKKQRVDNPTPAKSIVLPRLIAWEPFDSRDQDMNLFTKLIGSMKHLQETFGEGSDAIGFTSTESAPMVLRDLQARELLLFPYSIDISLKPPAKGIWIVVQSTVAPNPTQKLYVVAPTVVDNEKTKQAKRLSPFWNAVRVAVQAEEQETADLIQLKFAYHEFHTSLQVNAKAAAATSSKAERERFKGAKPDTKVVFKIPYLINTTAIQKGKGVRASAAANPIQSADDM